MGINRTICQGNFETVSVKDAPFSPAYYATKALFPNQIGMSTDICVPISKLAKAIKDTQNDLKKFNVTGSIIGHVGDGNYHTLLFSDPKNPEDLKLNKYLANRMA